jgi:hypothetical protein
MPEETISREVAFSRIRLKLIELCANGKSACRVATERNILCGGFRRHSDEELQQKYEPYVAGAERISRSDLERAANAWHLARQRTEAALVSCDVQYRSYEVCRGWNDFSNDELATFCFELSGVRPNVVGEIALPNM